MTVRLSVSLFGQLWWPLSAIIAINISQRISSGIIEDLTFESVLQKGNPFDMSPNPLHNQLIRAIVSQDTIQKIVNIFETGEKLYSTLCKGRYEDKTTRISSTIHKALLLQESPVRIR